jgi:hypothetical protein
MKERTYSKEIANFINNYLSSYSGSFSFDENKGLFRFSLGLKGKLKSADYSIYVLDDDFIVYASSPIGADVENKAMMSTMSEFVCRANFGMAIGNFEFDHRDGEIRFKVDVCCDDITPSVEMLRKSICCAAAMLDRYSNGIIDVVLNDASAKEAVFKCENAYDSLVDSIISRLANDDESSSDVLELLAARLGLDDESTETTEDNPRFR